MSLSENESSVNTASSTPPATGTSCGFTDEKLDFIKTGLTYIRLMLRSKKSEGATPKRVCYVLGRYPVFPYCRPQRPSLDYLTRLYESGAPDTPAALRRCVEAENVPAITSKAISTCSIGGCLASSAPCAAQAMPSSPSPYKEKERTAVVRLKLTILSTNY